MSSPRIPRTLLLCVTVFAHAQQPAWHMVEQTTHNETSRLLTTISTDTYRSADGSAKHLTLQLRCVGTPSATLSIGSDSGSDSDDTFAVKSDATINLAVRLDAGPVIPIGWANLSLHQILLYDLRDLLPSHRLLSIDLPLNNATPQTLTFDLSSLASTMRENNCRRRL